ncbi:hypothetical protein SMACR_03337 [Sordaria macrospora]|uniref:WGS project CABT00000000 data, contig 2.10 n=2 Tax=Sordaria macrospora TaxID=5147 RepID=F7VWL3_SORMK|nr:uncharacterized protein SMAC_03337 [Sordaria macrospora k-hell]KAA8629042.1 hypothetical protein SMACR_03337 [Sordaria macrospora]WPJ66704.1 hypothetical protein SMAC4_03337 [Sordaria macrospora]CCC09781.1 unnamed protein product [Sordaria macrospora k-hell]
MDQENETFFPNIRRYLSLSPAQQRSAKKPNPVCSICLANPLKCYPLNNHGPNATVDKEGNDLECMAILYCGHVVGYDCLEDYMSTCYNNFSRSQDEKDLPRCPSCRESLIKDCEKPYFANDDDQQPYYFMIPFVIAPSAPPIPGGPPDARENYTYGNPVQFNILDQGHMHAIAFSYNKWQDIPLTKAEGGLLPASCQCCDPALYRHAYAAYEAQQTALLGLRPMVMNNTLYATKGAPRLVPGPRPSVFASPPNRPTHNIWKLGFCVVARVPMEDGTEDWAQVRMRVGDRIMYQAALSDGTPVEIPLEPRCLGPPQFGPMRFGRHPRVLQGAMRAGPN